MLGKDHKGVAFGFFKPTVVSEGKLSGQPYRKGSTGAPILTEAPGAVECRVTSIVEQGDHHIVVGEVVDAHLKAALSGRPDTAILEMKDLGDNVFYGG
jgi:flavin reductase (DIM6/NTAB) family NADH-FMN oxidoreductase RutF